MTQEQYIRGRERLIPIAEGVAYEKVGPRPAGPHEKWAIAWNRVFHSTMDYLAWKEGLTR